MAVVSGGGLPGLPVGGSGGHSTGLPEGSKSGKGIPSRRPVSHLACFVESLVFFVLLILAFDRYSFDKASCLAMF